MAKINGKLFRTWLIDNSSETLIPLETTGSSEIGNELIDASDKDGDGWASAIDGLRSWSRTVTLNYDQVNEVIISLLDKIIDTDNSTEIDILMGQNAADGDIYWRGKALISGATISDDNNALTTVDFTLTGNGPLTRETRGE